MSEKPNGPCSFVVQNLWGALRYDGHYSDGVRDGLWRVTKAETGAPCWEVTWSNGKWHGPSRSWFDNGQLMKEGQHQDGYVTGLWTFWFETGQIAARGCYEHDRKVGDWEYFDPDGSPMDNDRWEPLWGNEYDFAWDDHTGMPRGENWPDPLGLCVQTSRRL